MHRFPSSALRVFLILHAIRPRFFCAVSACAVLAFCGVMSAKGQSNVTTYHNDIGRTGQNVNETILTTANVNTAQFGKLFSQPVDGQVYAQPLYLSGITVNGASHNVVFVATENDTVYAFDADLNVGANASPLWKASMLTAAHGAGAGATSIPASNLGSDINPVVGITGTPVIDSTTGTLYVVSADLEAGNAFQRLHALDVTTGLEKPGSPVLIKASVPGNGNGSVNGTLSFDPYWENQRGGLLLLNGIVWVGFASHGDNGPWHGWVMGYNAATLVQTGVYCTSPNGTGSGIWGAGAGLAADVIDPVNHPYGRMFIPTGNGDFNATKPYTNSMDYGDSHIALDLSNGVPTVIDEFTTYQQAKLDATDSDQGSGGLMVVPTQTTGTNPHLAVQAGKQGTLFLLNRDNLGGFNATVDQVVQSQPYTVGNVGVWSTPAYWNGNVYYWGQFDPLKSFALTNGLLSSTPVKSTEMYNYPGSTPSISANGNSQGIVWSINSSGYNSSSPAVLQAHDASNVAVTLYSSSTNPTRDTAGPAVKFTVPTVVNGKVYVGAGSEIDVYGLLNGANQTQSPVFNPSSQAFNGTLSVTLTDATPGAAIYYTTDGTTPTTSSTLYTGPVAVSTTETINAIAVASGFLQSAQTTASYTNVTQTPAVTFSLPTGSYATAQTVTLSDTAPNSVIYYTLDGSIPTTSSTVYTAPLAVSKTETVTAIAIAPGLTASPSIASTYTIIASGNGITFNQGFASSAGLMIFNGSTVLDDTRLQLTNGGTGQAGTAWYVTPMNVQAFTSDFTMQLSNAVANGVTFAIQANNVNALGGNAYDLGYAPIPNSLAIKFDLYNSAGEGINSTGLYLNGAIPTVPAIDLTPTGINLHSGSAIAVHLAYDGTTLTMTMTDIVTAAVWSTSWTVNIPASIGSNTAYIGFTGSTGAFSSSQKILTWSFVSTTPAATAAVPSFTPAGGTYTTPQNVTLSDSTTGATIYYTTDGTTPTTSSPQYATPIAVAASETIKAIAVATNFANSPVASATYTIAPLAATPVITPAAGSYTTAQTVTISDATSGASIYYTINGTTPTSASTLYSAPITVGASQTIKAIAIKTGFTNSAVASAAYTITTAAAAPIFSVPAGTYAAAQTVSISDSTAGAAIYYTLDGTTPTASSSLYSTPLSVSSTETIKALAVAAGFSNSSVASASYTISSTTPVINFAAGMSATNMNLYGAKIVGTALQITDGATGETHVAWYTKPVNIQAFTTDFNFQNTAATAEGFTFAIHNAPAGVWAVGGTSGGLGYSGIGASVAVKFDLYNNSGEGINSTGIYLNGAAPTTPSADMTASGVSLHNSNILHAHITYDGTTLTVTVTDTVTNASFTTSAAVNIPATVGANTATIGFTGTTGGLTATQSILNWTYLVNAANPTTATPTFSPAAGTYTAAQTVAISDATAGATIYYTTNGTAPTTASPVYSAPLTVSTTQTISALAVSAGNANSAVATAAYTISPVAATPTFSPAAGTYAAAQSVTITDATAGSTIYYTTNGTTPTTASAVYSSPILVGSTQTLKAIAVAANYTNSAVASAAYTINGTVATPTFTPAAGTYVAAQTVTIADATPGATIYYTTNGTTPTTASAQYTAPISVGVSETVNAIAVKTGFTNSAVASAGYVITPPAATPLFSLAAGTYSSPQTVSITDAISGAAIYYTTNGSAPTTSSTLYTAPIAVTATETINAIAVAPGYTNSSVASAAYTINSTTATPTFTPAAGTYTTTQTVSIGDATTGATIYYTTDGSTPTTASTVYATPITVSATETIKAIAVASGLSNSVAASASYTISATPPVINYPTTFTATGLNLYGAKIVTGALQMSDGGSSEQRAAWYSKPVNVQKFTTDFTFQDTAATADGMTFTIQNSPAGVWAVGGNGYALGYGGIPSSLAIKFDLYSNAGESNDSTGFYLNGASPTVPSIDMTSSGVNLHSGNVMRAHITYDGTTLTLTLTDTVTNATFTTSTAVNIPTTVGANTAYVGFTAGTGGLSATQNVLTWTYNVN